MFLISSYEFDLLLVSFSISFIVLYSFVDNLSKWRPLHEHYQHSFYFFFLFALQGIAPLTFSPLVQLRER